MRRRDRDVVRVSRFLNRLEDQPVERGDEDWTARWAAAIRSEVLGADRGARREILQRARRAAKGCFDYLHPLVGLAYYLLLELDPKLRRSPKDGLYGSCPALEDSGWLQDWLESELTGLKL